MFSVVFVCLSVHDRGCLVQDRGGEVSKSKIWGSSLRSRSGWEGQVQGPGNYRSGLWIRGGGYGSQVGDYGSGLGAVQIRGVLIAPSPSR